MMYFKEKTNTVKTQPCDEIWEIKDPIPAGKLTQPYRPPDESKHRLIVTIGFFVIILILVIFSGTFSLLNGNSDSIDKIWEMLFPVLTCVAGYYFSRRSNKSDKNSSSTGYDSKDV